MMCLRPDDLFQLLIRGRFECAMEELPQMRAKHLDGSLREAARIYRDSKISSKTSDFF